LGKSLLKTAENGIDVLVYVEEEWKSPLPAQQHGGQHQECALDADHLLQFEVLLRINHLFTKGFTRKSWISNPKYLNLFIPDLFIILED